MVTLAPFVLLWDTEGEKSRSMPAAVNKCLGLETDLCEEKLSRGMITMR